MSKPNYNHINTTELNLGTISVARVWEPTPHMRILKNENPWNGSDILQQMWYECYSKEREWRDVPIVVKGTHEDKLP